MSKIGVDSLYYMDEAAGQASIKYLSTKEVFKQ